MRGVRVEDANDEIERDTAKGPINMALPPMEAGVRKHIRHRARKGRLGKRCLNLRRVASVSCKSCPKSGGEDAGTNDHGNGPGGAFWRTIARAFSPLLFAAPHRYGKGGIIYKEWGGTCRKERPRQRPGWGVLAVVRVLFSPLSLPPRSSSGRAEWGPSARYQCARCDSTGPVRQRTSSVPDATCKLTNRSSATNDQRPATGDQRPATGDRRPATSIPRPETRDERQATSDQQPATSAQRPAPSHQPPATSNQQLATSD